LRQKVNEIFIQFYQKLNIKFKNLNIAEEKTALSDLEKLARREKIYCMTQQQQQQQNSESDHQSAASSSSPSIIAKNKL
jgi:hypothetical protein